MQLKDFIERKRFNPEIDDNYFAKAQQKTDSGSDDILKEPVANLIIAFYIISIVFVVLITVMLLMMYRYSKRWDTKLKIYSIESIWHCSHWHNNECIHILSGCCRCRYS